METNYITLVFHHDQALVIQPKLRRYRRKRLRRLLTAVAEIVALLLAFSAIAVWALAIPAG